MSIRGTAEKAGRLAAAMLLALAPAGTGRGQSLAQGFSQGPGPGSGGGQPLLPPSLPSALPLTLPGGQPLPSLSGVAQQDILQRILDAAGGRAGSPAPQPPAPQPIPAYSPPPSVPQGSPAFRPEAAEPLSNTEAFFAARGSQQLTLHPILWSVQEVTMRRQRRAPN